MRTAKKRLALLIISFLLVGASTAYSSGIPAADMYVAGSSSVLPINVIIVVKYDAASYTFAEAEALSQIVSKLLGVTSTLAGSIGLSTAGLSHYTPSQLAAAGYTDADTLKILIKNSYQALGFNFYAFVDISRVTSVTPALGPAMRIDIWFADLALVMGMTGDYLYIASLEIPEAYLTLLGSAY